jgi:hypothetical protein
MTTTTTEIFDRSVEGAISNDTIRPQLFTVGAGSYVSNAVYGSGIAAVNNYDTVTLRGSSSPYTQSKVDVRQHDHDVFFSMAITLDTTVAAPFTGTNEVRIRTQPITLSEPNRYLKTLPAPDTAYGQPLFETVEVLVIDTTGAAAPVHLAALASTELRARFLHGGELALVQEGAPAVPITAANLTTAFAAANTALRISVSGHYRAVSSSN